MSVIRSQHDVVLPCVLENMWKVIVDLASHINPAVAQQVVRDLAIPRMLSAGPPDVMQNVRDPLGADLDKTESKIGKLLWESTGYNRFKCADDGEFELHETSAAGCPVIQFQQLG